MAAKKNRNKLAEFTLTYSRSEKNLKAFEMCYDGGELFISCLLAIVFKL